jgi:chromosome condensin MukBEF complex kleisin-like MukF subunit
MSDLQCKGVCRSRREFLTLSGAALTLPLVGWIGPAAAEEAPAAPQVALTAKQVEQYIASFKELTALFDKLEAAGDKADKSLLAQVDSTMKKYGFKDLDEYDAVANSIAVVMDGIDTKSKQYVDPVVSIKQAIADIQKDKSMSPAERKKAIEELNAELKEVQPVRHKGNIDLVLKYYDRLAALVPQAQ